MSQYDFTSLSSQDFEELVRDLLQAEWNVSLEAFKAGRDSGIDLRYSPANGGATIVQCKHYLTSGFGKLLTNLRKSELPKIERLAPKRYVVATSVGLTPANKDEIVDALRPFVQNASDILGAQDIEGLLSRHPSIERANFKLWLTSTSVLERILHNAEHCQTNFKIDRIRKKLPLFVQNEAFPRAVDLLEQTRIVVISGIPGIGKTTLAEMLLYDHLERGYEPIVIQAEIAEGKKLFKTGAKQIFYYDDFLGQTFLGDRREYLGRNEDAAIVDFMEMIRQSPHGRFVLTTREHILSNALQLSEKLSHSTILSNRCVLELRDYSYGQKARILYNHLYFSDLPQPYKDAVLENNFFLTIIKHKHFNPRLIEWLSSYTRLKGLVPDKYQMHIARLLDSPESIWNHAFRNQISGAARNILISLYTLGDWIETRDLEPAFLALHRQSAAKYHQPIAAGDFRIALQELDGAFLSYSTNHASYLNPSIREFVASVISGGREITGDLLTSAVRFKQLAKLWELSEARPNGELAAFLAAKPDLLVNSLSRLLHGPTLRWEKMRDGTQRGSYIDLCVEDRIAFLIKVAETQQSKLIAALASQVTERLIATWKHHVPEFPTVIKLLREFQEKSWLLDHGGREIYRSLLDGILDQLSIARANDWLQMLQFPYEALEWTEADEPRVSEPLKQYLADGVDYERLDCTTLDEMSDLRETLDNLSKDFGLDFADDIRNLDEAIDEIDESRDEDNERSGYSGRAASTHTKMISDDDVAQMFSTLHEII